MMKMDISEGAQEGNVGIYKKALREWGRVTGAVRTEVTLVGVGRKALN